MVNFQNDTKIRTEIAWKELAGFLKLPEFWIFHYDRAKILLVYLK